MEVMFSFSVFHPLCNTLLENFYGYKLNYSAIANHGKTEKPAT